MSLFTTLISRALSPMHTFFDCASLYRDDELRKTLEHIVRYKVLTAQEGTEGGSANASNLRHDRYKKIFPGGPISRRLPYAESSKLASIRRMMRFELNQALAFNNAKGAKWRSIYRMSLAIRPKGKYIPVWEYRALSDEQRARAGVFVKDYTLTTFLESRPDASAFLT